MHRCSLSFGSGSMLPKQKGANVISRMCRELRKLGQVSRRHPETCDYFMSDAAIVFERQKMLFESPTIIHPFSIFNITWTFLMLMIDICQMIACPFRVAFYLQPPLLHTIDNVILFVHAFCFVDIVVKINMGFVVKSSREIVTDRNRIMWQYLGNGFLFDLISCLPVAYVLLYLESKNKECILIAHLLPLFRISRACNVLKHLKTILNMFTRSPAWHCIINLLLQFILIIHWLSCLIYMPPVIKYYQSTSTDDNMTSTHFMDISAEYLVSENVAKKYEKSLFVAVSSFLGAGYSFRGSQTAFEIVTISAVMVLSALFHIFLIVSVLNLFITQYDSIIRYYELINQVDKYMRHKQFPAHLKNTVISFYKWRYQERYYKEDKTLNSLSGIIDYSPEQLRIEMNVYTNRRLVMKVKLFQGVSDTLLSQLVDNMNAEVYMPDELIVKAGDIGDCIYFIESGTVAVYSAKGAEVCHLGDGEHFGEVALIMKDSKRIATVVSIEITIVYIINGTDFRRLVLSDSLLYKRIEGMASRRMQETVLLDDSYKKKRELQARSSSNIELG